MQKPALLCKFLVLLLLGLTSTLNAQIKSGDADVDFYYGRAFNFKGNKDLSNFLQEYNAVNASTLSKEGKLLKFSSGYDLGLTLKTAKINFDLGYTKLHSKTDYLFKNGDVRSFELKNGGWRVGAHLVYYSNRWSWGPYYAISIGRQKVNATFQAATGSPNNGSLLNGEYQSLAIQNTLGFRFHYAITEKLNLYLRAEYAFALFASSLDDPNFKHLPLKYRDYAAQGALYYTGENVNAKWNGLQPTIGLSYTFINVNQN